MSRGVCGRHRVFNVSYFCLEPGEGQHAREHRFGGLHENLGTGTILCSKKCFLKGVLYSLNSLNREAR